MNNISNKKAPSAPRRRPGVHLHWQVEETEVQLLDFLIGTALKDRSRTTVKQLLKDRFISVNEEPTTQFDRLLGPGDIVALHPTPLPDRLKHPLVDILWQDEYLVMVHKDAGIPTVASGEERDMTLLRLVSDHLKKFNPSTKIYLLNRIDKDSAGFVLFAKSKALQEEMSEHWDRYICRQHFAVAIEGVLPSNDGILQPPTTAREDEKRAPRSAKNPHRTFGAERAGTARYRCLQTTPVGSLLSIELSEGRNNRLRKQFAQLRCPIVGDWRAGSKVKDLGRVALEGTAFSFVHPISGRRYDFDQPIPPLLRKCLKPNAETGKKNSKSKQ